MKKIFVLLMCALMLSLASCSSNGDSDFSVSSPETTTTTASQDKTEESTDSADVSGDEYPFATPIVPDGLSLIRKVSRFHWMGILSPCLPYIRILPPLGGNAILM